ncbi:EF-hand domain-containing protein [Rubinisphaera margarita]|uniref:EF-hand domain-containing protein n=1 Tax=Rubinisphaera margarita TaxID=2909586 RepID=UPI001EE83C61|nr:EF-hand domain-containing protein [Rubinisphaera margarita]
MGIQNGDADSLKLWQTSCDRVFRELDTDQNGVLTRAECERVSADKWLNVPGARPLADEATEQRIRMNKVLVARDKDHDGRISLAEYLLSHTASKDGKSFFARLDKDQDAYLTPSEFFQSPEAGPPASVLFTFFDVDQDSFLTTQELQTSDNAHESLVMAAIFAAADADSDGHLSGKEFEGSLLSQRAVPPFASVSDINRDGQIEQREFTAQIYGHVAEQRLELFKELDKNNNNALSQDEFPFIERLHIIHGSLERQPQFDAEFRQLEQNQDGSLSLDEFRGRSLPADEARRREVSDFPEFVDGWFAFLDLDASDSLSFDEFRLNQTAQFRRYDKSADKLIDLEELLSSVAESNHDSATAAFRWFDHNDDSKWSPEEFERSTFAAPARDRLFEGFDRNADQQLSHQEYFAFYEGLELKQAIYNFERLDLDLSNTISLDEFRNTVALGPLPAEIFQAYDTDNSGSVEAEEYLSKFAEPAHRYRRSQFDHFDRSPRDGKLAFEEFQSLEVARPSPRQAFQGLDTDSDDTLSRDEFLGPHIDRFRTAAEISFRFFDSDQDQSLSIHEYAATPEARTFLPSLVHAFVDPNDDDRTEWEEVASFPSVQNHIVMLRHYFNVFDTNQDQTLTLEEFPLHIHVPVGGANLSPIVSKFLKLDTDGSGWLSVEEFRHREPWKLPGAEDRLKEWQEEAESVFATRDENQDGCLTWREFNPGSQILSPWVTAYGEKIELPEPAYFVRHVYFYAQDKNADYFLTAQELVNGVGVEALRREILESEFPLADLNRDEKISREEFEITRLARVHVIGEFKRRDQDQSGSLDESEFALFMPPQHSFLISTLFRRFDEDRSRSMDEGEFAITPVGKGMIGHVFNLVDWDKDGAVSLEEFIGEQKGDVAEELKELFIYLDTNADNTLDYGEYPIFKQSLPPGSPHLFEEHDANRDGQLTFAEFWNPSLRGSIRKPEVSLKQAMAEGHKEFQQLDVDHSNSLTLAEFQQQSLQKGGRVSATVGPVAQGGVPAAFLRPGYQPRPETAEEVLSRLDENEDELLSREEYGSYFKTRLPAEIDREFARFDLDGNERLTLAEFQRSPPSNPPPETMFEVRDKDQDKQLTLEEFVDQFDREPTARERRIFERFDADKNGSLALSEFRATGIAKPDSQIIVETRDLDGDRRLTLQEYREDVGAAPLPHEEALFKTMDVNADGYVALEEFQSFEPTRETAVLASADVQDLPELSPKSLDAGPSSSWLWIGGICAGVLAVGLIVQFGRRR